MILSKLIKDNSYPIIFVGSGMSKRYLTKSPTWIELLEYFWNKIDYSEDFYGKLNDIKDVFLKSGHLEMESRFLANIRMASIIEESYNQKFNKGEIIISNLSTKEAYTNNISPFKHALSEIFNDYTLDDTMNKEFESWKQFIRKSQIIITTNYDTLIEDSYSDGSKASLKKYIGQEGFFDKTSGSAELFKIHGCCTDPNSIIINEEDYNLFNKNSVLISAKILSSLITSPIIFLGYSLSDANVRKIISDFTSQLPKEDSRISENRIIVIEYAKGVMQLDETIIHDSEIGSYTLIKTDNYKLLYDKISSINQGLSPYEIRRYQDVIKKLIVIEGQKGTLDAVLLSLKEIDELERDISMNKPIAVALGDKKYMYVMPDLITYIKDYIFEENNVLPSIALKFISREPIKARIPFSRYLSEGIDINKLGLDSREKENLRNKVNKYMQTLDEIIDDISNSNKKDYTQLYEIWNNSSYGTSKKIEIIIYNIKKLDRKELDHFIKEEAFPLLKESMGDDSSALKSVLRKLFYAYDLLIHGDLRPI